MDDFISSLIHEIELQGELNLTEFLTGKKQQVVIEILKQTNKVEITSIDNVIMAKSIDNYELLFNGPPNELVTLNEPFLKGLKLIFSKREVGILQRDLNIELGMAPKDTSYMLKRFKEFKLIETVQIFPSPLIVHIKFKNNCKYFDLKRFETDFKLVAFQEFLKTEDVNFGLDRLLFCQILEHLFNQTTNDCLSRSEAINILVKRLIDWRK